MLTGGPNKGTGSVGFCCFGRPFSEVLSTLGDIVDHPHIEDLLEQAEQYRLRREIRDARPDRITDFITDVAEAFEPLLGVARVGFDCSAKVGGWAISMYLGATEVVGGRDDGMKQHIPFNFDIDSAVALFTNVESVQFRSQPSTEGVGSGVVITGHIDQYPISLAIHSVPPEAVAPGFQRLPDRSLRLT